MRISELKQQGIADRACGSFAGDLTLDRAIRGNVSVDAMCAVIRFHKMERADIVKLLNAMAGSVVTYWPRTSRGFSSPEASDVLEWLDTASDAVADSVGLSDWVAK